MAYRSGAKGTSRHFGLEGAGKGDASRVLDMQKYQHNFDEILWPLTVIAGFTPTGKPGRTRKKY